MSRNVSIEYLKAVLVSVMVFTHSFALLGTLIPGNIGSQAYYLFSVIGTLIVFSGFIFCFGYASYHAYLSKPFAQVRHNLITTAKNQLISYYISALLAVAALPILGRANGVVQLSDVGAVLGFTYIAPYSEFMLAYFLITVITLLLFKPLVALSASPLAMFITGLLSLVATVLIPYDLFIDNPLGLFVGSRSYAAFPLVQYGVFYVMGLYFARFAIVWKWPIAVMAVAGTLFFGLIYLKTGSFPVRFPPSIGWICGSWGILYGLYLLINWGVAKGFTSPLLLMMGGNTLLFLLLSNMILFALSSRFKTTPLGAMLIGIAVLMACCYMVQITRKPSPIKQPSTPVIEPTELT
ncbi:hypothetical protein [Fibrella forsythiae]|uniref:Acyltransferase n=1 Tax=Fibrella forsythiae TaxID=2817061 RepID=A0ABS3JS89_9BACT|nr:hypothetical protein [Fibrella forsythiae]MBO0952246.1 hypothetical protein [Fibrella forsythiae]